MIRIGGIVRLKKDKHIGCLSHLIGKKVTSKNSTHYFTNGETKIGRMNSFAKTHQSSLETVSFKQYTEKL